IVAQPARALSGGEAVSPRAALFLDRYWRAHRSVFEKSYRHLPWQTNATVRRGKRRNVTLMHRVAAAEEHRIRHSGALKLCAGRVLTMPPTHLSGAWERAFRQSLATVND